MAHGVTLRSLEAGDLDLVAGLYRDPEVMRYSRVGVLNREQAGSHLQNWLRPSADRYWAVSSRRGAEDTGIVFLRNLDRVHRSAEIGYVLARDVWGQGIATATVASVMEIAFGHLALCRVEAYVSAGNGASLRVLEKNGFAREGLRRADVYRDGRFGDSFLLARLNEPLIRALTAEHAAPDAIPR